MHIPLNTCNHPGTAINIREETVLPFKYFCFWIAALTRSGTVLPS